MRLQMLGCSHHGTSLVVRERLAFSPAQAGVALARFRDQFRGAEAVLLSTCNRTEIYTAAEDPRHNPSHQQLAEFLADFHGLDVYQILDELLERTGEDVVRHLFTVAASLDSMVLGEPQILSQVKQAYQIANECRSTGPVTHAIFQAAVKVARRVSTETQVSQRRVSIPSVAVGEFATQIFERFDDKRVLVIGAGEMAEETLRYLAEAGVRHVTVVNRSSERAVELASRWSGSVAAWESLTNELAAADVVISTTGAEQPIITRELFAGVYPGRYQRPLFVLDLAVPRDFAPEVGDFLGVYLYTLDDLRQACARNRAQRDGELPAALQIVEEEAARFMTDLYHRQTGPIIHRLREGWQKPKEEELRRLLNRLPELSDRGRDEVRQAFDRLINKLLHPPLESLRDEARGGTPHLLLDALKRLFQLKD